MFWKQRDTFLNPKYKGLGWWAMPNILIFQYIIPLFSPLADVLMIFWIIYRKQRKNILYYLIFLLVDASLALIAFLFEKEKISGVLHVIPPEIGLQMANVHCFV